MTTGLLTPTHIAILLVIILLLFGAQRVPETGRALGRGIREFTAAITGREEDSPKLPTHDTRGHADGGHHF